MAAKACPKCELKFSLSAEVADHLERDHDTKVQLPAGADLLGRSRKKH